MTMKCHYLDLSTAHVREQDALQLSQWANDETAPLGVAEDSYGFWLMAQDDDVPEWPEAIRAVIAKARSLQCSAIRLDRDGATVDDLPIYDW